MSNEFLSKVFKWFGLGLLTTFLVAYAVSISEKLIITIFTGGMPFIILILELVCAIWLSARINKMKTSTAIVLYLGYTALTGLTFSSIFIMYEISSIIWIFLVTSIVFGIFALIGSRLKINLSKFGIYLLIGLISIIILEIINIFLMNNTIDMFLCVISLIIFICYVAYDIQMLKRLDTNNDNMAIIGAFNIYLDFINIFLRLIQLFGKSRD